MDSSEKKRILIIRPAALGDTLMLLPALNEIRHSHSVILAGRKPGIYYLNRFAGLCLDFEGMGWHTLFTDEPNVQNLPASDIVAAFLRDEDGRVRRSLESLFPGGSIRLFPGLPEESGSIHAALHLARCLRVAGCSEIDPGECIAQSLRHPLLRSGREGASRDLKGGRIIFHPGSGGPEKNHSREFWVEIIETMMKTVSFRCLDPTILLGPAEEPLISLFERRLSGIRHNLISSPDPESLLSILRDASLFLGQDSGVTHLAAMSGTPTIALFRSSSAEMWRPLGPRVSVIQEKRDRVDIPLVLKEAMAWLAKSQRDDG